MTETAADPKSEVKLPMDIREILNRVPHRFPFILVDRVTELTPEQHIKGYKNVTINEPFFQGHFPEDPIMPGVLQLEALAQLGVILLGALPIAKGKLAVFAGMEHVRFRRVVVPGDRLDLECTLIKLRPPIAKMACKAYVNNEPAAEAELICSLLERTPNTGQA